MGRVKFVRRYSSWIVVCLCAVSSAQQLTLEQALKLASERNGTLRAAQLDVVAADARTKQALSAFYPTLTPSLEYNDSRQDLLTGVPAGFTGRTVQSGLTSQVQARWQVLDTGERELSFRSARANFDAQAASSLRTYRSILFDVITQYYEAIRTSELVKVQDAQVERAKKIVEQVRRQIEEGDAAEKDIFQPRSDELNATVNRLSAQTRQVRANTELKSTIGWEYQQALPELATFQEPTEFPEPAPLEELIKMGIENRPDLIAQRAQLRSQEYLLKRTKINASIGVSLDLSFTKQFGPDNLNNRLLSLTASIPLFDGGRSREAVRESQAGLDSSRATLTQTERGARSEIESSWRELSLNAQRVAAAIGASEAARVNYDRVTRAYDLKAATIVEVSTALVSLVTAESNRIEAVFDYAISQERLKLATGQTMPGEIAEAVSK